MTSADVYPGLWPVATYGYSNNMVSPAGVGTMFKSDTNSFSIILPEHMFVKKFEGVYIVRSARPNIENAIGFLEKIVLTGSNYHGLDIVVATLGTNQTFITNVVSTERVNPKYTVLVDAVISKGKEVRKLRSLITGEEATVLGYDTQIQSEVPEIPKEDYPQIIINLKSSVGQSGSAFIDEYGRIFILSQSYVENDNPTIKAMGEFFFKKNGKKMEGATVVVGPIELKSMPGKK
jgi:hypothetical protein